MEEKPDFVKRLEEEIRVGNKIFKRLFKMNDKKLKKVLASVCSDFLKEHNAGHILEETGQIKRTIINMQPETIEIYFYDKIKIAPLGITYYSEHARGAGVTVVKFDKHFKI